MPRQRAQQPHRPARRQHGWRVRVFTGVLLLLLMQDGCRAQQSWPLWQHYRARFMEPSGRIVDHSSGDRSTSEGQAYALFFALVANDRSSFDVLLRWTEDNLAGGDLTARLPAWNWGKTASGEWKQIDTNSAADADLWLAYDCLEAGRLWKDDRLFRLGLVLADRIAHSEVALTAGAGTVLLPGPQGFHPANAAYVLNPSYSPPQLLMRLQEEQPAGPWRSILQSLPSLLAQSSPSGFAPDWAEDGATVRPTSSPAERAQGRGDAPARGSYDAIRVYLWLGMADGRTPGVHAALASLSGMAGYLSGNILPPLAVQSDGKVLQPDGPVGFSAAMLPYLDGLGRKAALSVQRNRLAASLQPDSGLYGRDPAYYDQNLALFGSGWMDGQFRFDREGRLKVRWKG